MDTNVAQVLVNGNSAPGGPSGPDDAVEAGSVTPPRRTRGRRRGAALSHRERVVLVELAYGRSTDEIAERLYVSPHTIRTHVKNVMRKLDARTRAHAVAIGMREGMIDE